MSLWAESGKWGPQRHPAMTGKPWSVRRHHRVSCCGLVFGFFVCDAVGPMRWVLCGRLYGAGGFGFGLVWFGLVWFGLVWFGLVWFGLVWFGLVWFGLVWFGLVWFSLASAIR
ncbi:hypothetical protein [Paraburkholderia caribensis]|uniref:hypothetical protein n=1 Tax=Paraburkholderia caribensis TaxID=75105 RepID=UPI000AD32B4C|nr:hypothetical protein [Paraburkholderia caribensis]